MAHTRLLEVCALTPRLQAALAAMATRLQLSARAVHRCLRVARTLADMEECAGIQQRHLHEALAYRSLESPLAS